MKNPLKRILFALKPHQVLALLVALAGGWILHNVVLRAFGYVPDVIASFDTWKKALMLVGLLEIPRGLLGFGLVLMAIGLLLRARIAWIFSLLLLIPIIFLCLWTEPISLGVGIYSAILFVLLIVYRKYFDRDSIAAGTLFALVSFLSLSTYAVFGSLYLGEEFNPAISDMQSAVYFAFVSMSTVGYGDIVPHTASARMFALSVIFFGITVFATSVSVIVGPLIGGNIKKIFTRRVSYVMRKDHYIIAGATPLALSIYNGLRERDAHVTIITPLNVPHKFPADADVVIGDPTDPKELLNAGIDKALYILALRDDDAENAFIILAAKEVVGKNTKTIAMVNTIDHLQKIKFVQPDLLFSLQLLGSELLVRTLNGEQIDNNLVTELFFANSEKVKAAE